jgi:chromosome partitioning protein
MRTVAFVNQKGGVGKTTSVSCLGAALSRRARRVLLVDLDPQANLTEGFGIETDDVTDSIYDVIVGGMPLNRIIVPVADNLDLAPANIDLSGAETELLQLPGKDLRLKKALEGANGYDYILIDCPPSLGQLTLNALSAAKEVVIPVQTEYFALKGLQKLLRTLDMVKEWSNQDLSITGILATRYDGRRNLNRSVAEQLSQHFGEELVLPMVRENVALAEAPTTGSDIFKYKMGSHGAQDYQALCDRIIQQEDTHRE